MWGQPALGCPPSAARQGFLWWRGPSQSSLYPDETRPALNFHSHSPNPRTNDPPISISPTLKPPNLSQKISKWSLGCAALQTLTGDPYLPRTGILPPFAIVATALHAAPVNKRKVCGLFFLGLFSHNTTAQKPMQHQRFGYICQIILAGMISILSPDSTSAKPDSLRPEGLLVYRTATCRHLSQNAHS